MREGEYARWEVSCAIVVCNWWCECITYLDERENFQSNDVRNRHGLRH